MGSIDSIGNSLMTAVLERAQTFSGMALLNLLDASRKVEVALASPLGAFGIGGMVDTYA